MGNIGLGRVVQRCDQCGQWDDHPKVHIANGGTYHHDCLPADLRELHMAHPQARSIIEAAESGIRGADLLEHIVSIHREG